MAQAIAKYKVPSCKYNTKIAVPALKKKITEQDSRKLETVQAVSFTTGIWSDDIAPLSLLRLSVHWVDTESLNLETVVLHANDVFKGSHSDEAIAGAQENMLLN